MMVNLEIDGTKTQVEQGTTLLKTAQRMGIEIPYFCYHQDMEPYGGCRLCMVEVTENGATRLQPSCAYPAKEGLVVKTHTESLITGRELIVELLLARCPDVKAVQNLAGSLGVTKTRFRKDEKKCVLCGQCVRVCQNVAKAGAIDFIGRGIKRRVGTPFDLPSEDCIGCGSCAYVCPTGAMKMEYENALRWRRLPGPMRKCRYMRMGLISHKVCPNNYECWNCEVDQRMEDLAKTHPVFMLKHARESEKEKIGPFEILFDRLYGEGHVWVKAVDRLARLGIDDFTRRILGRIDDIKLPPVNRKIEKGQPIWVITAGDKTLQMTSPIDGKIVDINPDIQDNPSLIGMDPYGRGWIVTLLPKDILQTSRALLSGRSAKEWLKVDANHLFELMGKTAQSELSEIPFPDDFAGGTDKNLWKEIDRTFYQQK